MAINEQLIIRSNPATSARLAAVAAATDCTISEVVRNLIDEGIEAKEAAAREAAARREKLPNGVTDDSTAVAVHAILRQINRSEPVVLAPRDLLSSRSRALWQLLSAVWTNDEIATATRNALAKKLASASPSGPVADAEPDAPADKPIKNYPRRERAS